MDLVYSALYDIEINMYNIFDIVCIELHCPVYDCLIGISNKLQLPLRKFNIVKRRVMDLDSENSGHRYSTNGEYLDKLKSERDLGVIVSHDLKV